MMQGKVCAYFSSKTYAHTIYLIDHKISSGVENEIQFMGLMISKSEEASPSKQTHKSLE